MVIVPQTVKFVRFQGDRVALVKIAAMGRPMEVHNTNELGDFLPGSTNPRGGARGREARRDG